ncbi:MAG: flagellar basal-body rod protein FlgG [Candidatus Krumholzibacteriota bacterium]|nr:flagellar basal-body rod protein FlgG [Candidatus Krumholzibacteriota bacterium]
MIRALSTASSGMQSQQIYIDNIANNLANVNTPGFKKTRVEFHDLLYEKIGPVGASRLTGTAEPAFSQVGHGVRLAATTRIYSQGSSMSTENPLDIMIDGDGFIQVLLPDGTYAYTRDGTLKLDSEGNVVTSAGFRIEPTLVLPRETSEFLVSGDGMVSVLLQSEEEPTDLGRMEIVRFQNPAGLKSIGHNLFTPTLSSGDPILGNPGEEGMGLLQMGFLEMSNVSVIEEMIGMITAQRAYEINSKAVKSAEEMLGIAANLKR